MKKKGFKLFLVCVLMTGWIVQYNFGWATSVDVKEVEEETALENAVLQDNNSLYMLVGTYTRGTTTGLHLYKFNQETGTAEFVSNAEASNASYLTFSANERFVYAVSEGSGDAAAVNAFSFDKAAGKLTLLNTQQVEGASPCYISTDPSGSFVVTANYTGGSVSVLPLSSDGSLQPIAKLFQYEGGSGVVPRSQDRPHLHCVVFSPNKQILYSADLGNDNLYQFTVSSTAPFLTPGSPESFKMEPGSGPRHLTFHPNGRFAYLLNELSGKVTVFNYTNGNLEPIEYVVADDAEVKQSADIHITPDGKFLYASNRASTNNIAIFSINATDGKLTLVGHQPTSRTPRNFIITPNGNYLLAACQGGNQIHVFKINKDTGILTEDTSNLIEIATPVCIKFAGIN